MPQEHLLTQFVHSRHDFSMLLANASFWWCPESVLRPNMQWGLEKINMELSSRLSRVQCTTLWHCQTSDTCGMWDNSFAKEQESNKKHYKQAPTDFSMLTRLLTTTNRKNRTNAVSVPSHSQRPAIYDPTCMFTVVRGPSNVKSAREASANRRTSRTISSFIPVSIPTTEFAGFVRQRTFHN